MEEELAHSKVLLKVLFITTVC